MNEAKKNLEISIQELKQVRTLIARLDRERREAAESLNTLQESNDGIRTQILKVQSELKVATDFLASKPFNPKAEGEKATEKKKLEEQMREVSRKLDGLELGGDHRLDVKYTIPTEDFDRDLVKGRVAKLFQIKEERYAAALEAVAGKKLFYIVVDNDVASSLLLKHDSFPNRVNLIPNNKIKAKEIKKEVVDYVRNVTKGRARFATEVIKYHSQLENTM